MEIGDSRIDKYAGKHILPMLLVNLLFYFIERMIDSMWEIHIEMKFALVSIQKCNS